MMRNVSKCPNKAKFNTDNRKRLIKTKTKTLFLPETSYLLKQRQHLALVFFPYSFMFVEAVSHLEF